MIKNMLATHCARSVCIRNFSGSYFPTFGLNTEIYTVNLHNQSGFGKIQTTKTPNTHPSWGSNIPLQNMSFWKALPFKNKCFHYIEISQSKSIHAKKNKTLVSFYKETVIYFKMIYFYQKAFGIFLQLRPQDISLPNRSGVMVYSKCKNLRTRLNFFISLR